MPEMPFAAIAWVQRGDEFLAVSRKHDHEDLGFAGGKPELVDGKPETPEQTAARELKEETSLIAKKLRALYCAKSATNPFLTWVFLIEDWEGEPRSMEGTWVGWVKAPRLVDKRNSFWPYYLRMFEELNVNYR